MHCKVAMGTTPLLGSGMVFYVAAISLGRYTRSQLVCGRLERRHCVAYVPILIERLVGSWEPDCLGQSCGAEANGNSPHKIRYLFAIVRKNHCT